MSGSSQSCYTCLSARCGTCDCDRATRDRQRDSVNNEPTAGTPEACDCGRMANDADCGRMANHADCGRIGGVPHQTLSPDAALAHDQETFCAGPLPTAVGVRCYATAVAGVRRSALWHEGQRMT